MPSVNPKTIQADGFNADALLLAAQIITAQQAEITEMQALLQELTIQVQSCSYGARLSVRSTG